MSALSGEPSPFGDYQVEREIARGGMGTVYAGYDRKLKRPVAIKVLHRKDGAALARFEREARIAAKLRHDHIVPIYTVGDGWLAMAFIEGVTMDVAARERPLRERIAMLHTVAGAVAYAHAQGVVHRDLKPQNVLVERGSGKVWLTDFGLAQEEGAERLTASGARLGTLPYMAPEQVRGERGRIGPSTDVWALGVMLHELVGGSLPFTTPEAVQHDAPPEIVGAPADLRAIWSRALAKDESGRHANAGAFAEDLRRHLAGEPVQGAESSAASSRCPYCAEPIRTEAVICPHCRTPVQGPIPEGPRVVPDPPPGQVWCTECGYVGSAVQGGLDAGACLLGGVLLAAGVLPGLIYMVARWYWGGTRVCARCGAKTLVRAPDSRAKQVATVVFVLVLLAAVGWFWWYLLTTKGVSQKRDR